MARVIDTCWEGRTWIQSIPADNGPKKSFRVLSYNVLSDYKTSFLHYTTTRNWDLRKQTLLCEIKTYDIDIICLQDVDHYQDWWRPQLTLLGYDTVYQPRTQTKNFHYEGVLIAFRRDVFQLFKSMPFELNDAVTNEDRGRAFMERSKTDDVGVIVFLQPWSRDCVNSALCVCCTMLSDDSTNSDIRMVQTQYVARRIEVANMEFHVPVILAISMYDTPNSLSYTVMSTGRVPLAGQVPKRCKPPTGQATCRGSVLLKWYPPPSSLADFPILHYRISWRPGGSQVLAFRAEIEVTVGDCVKYAERMDEHRNIRMVALEERQFTITGLVSDVPYEFRVAAVNEVGSGVWSDVSLPVVMDNPSTAPPMPELCEFVDIVQLNESREQQAMHRDDMNASRQERIDAMSSQTQLTPRNLQGDVNPQVARSRVLPYETNPREGWKSALNGGRDGRIDEAINKESIINKSVLRDHSGFKNKALNRYVGVEEIPLTGLDGLEPLVGGRSKMAPSVEALRLQDRNAVLLDGKEVMDTLGVPNKRQTHDLCLSSAYTGYGVGGEPLFTASMPSEKNKVGTECLDYLFYSTGTLVVERLLSMPLLSEVRRGERLAATVAREDPLYVQPFLIARNSFDTPIVRMNQTLGVTLGEGGSLLGGDVGPTAEVPRDAVDEGKRLLRAALEKSRTAGNTGAASAKAAFGGGGYREDRAGGPPEGRGATKSAASGLWGGKWAAPPVLNHQRSNYWLPSETYASSHIALGAEFSIDDGLLCTHWS